MTYLAPKQGVFTLIVFASYLLHILFFAVSLKQESVEHHRVVAEQKIEELKNELVVVLATNDRIGASVLAGKYAQDPLVASVTVYDAGDGLIANTGQSGDGYQTKKQPILSGEKSVGSVLIEMEAVSFATILSSHWLFLLAALFLHGLLVFAYTLVARPSKVLQNKIAEDVRKKLLSQDLLFSSPYVDFVHQHHNSQLQADEPKGEPEESDSEDQALDFYADSAAEHDPRPSYVVKVCFSDKDHLLQAVGYDIKQAYFALCDQLLEKAAKKLLEQPLLQGVSVVEIESFRDYGASIKLVGNHDHSKTATAALLLSQLVLMVNQIVYDKHRELGRFALLMNTAASHASQSNAAFSVLNRRNLSNVILFDTKAKNEVLPYASLKGLENPGSVAERECQVVVSLGGHTVERLRTARDAVLIEKS